MSPVKLAVLVVAACLAGCSLRPATYPPRAAELYPLSQTRDGISVAVDEVRTPARSERYFLTDLPERYVLPVAVIISNYSSHSVVLRPADVLLHQGNEVFDPLPALAAAAVVREAHGFLAGPLENYFDGVALKERVLTPGESYHGVMFFILPADARKPEPRPQLPVFLTDGRLQVVVAARDLDTQARLRFGPFTLPPLQEDDN
jgi:hypothetical protein